MCRSWNLQDLLQFHLYAIVLIRSDLLLSILLLGALAHPGSSEPLYRQMQGAGTAAPHIYEDLVPEALRALTCEALDDSQRDDLFVATHIAHHHVPGEITLDRLRCLHHAMARDGAATQFHHLKLHGALVASRHFGEANRLRRKHRLQVAELPRLPMLRDGVPSFLSLDPQGEIGVVRFRAERGWRILAVVHPGCAHSRRATRTLFDAPEYAWLLPFLTPILPTGQKWLQQEMMSWNRNHPDHPLLAEIPGRMVKGVTTSETPVFFLLRDGSLVDEIRGLSTQAEAFERWKVWVSDQE